MGIAQIYLIGLLLKINEAQSTKNSELKDAFWNKWLFQNKRWRKMKSPQKCIMQVSVYIQRQGMMGETRGDLFGSLVPNWKFPHAWDTGKFPFLTLLRRSLGALFSYVAVGKPVLMWLELGTPFVSLFQFDFMFACLQLCSPKAAFLSHWCFLPPHTPHPLGPVTLVWWRQTKRGLHICHGNKGLFSNTAKINCFSLGPFNDLIYLSVEQGVSF